MIYQHLIESPIKYYYLHGFCMNYACRRDLVAWASAVGRLHKNTDSNGRRNFAVNNNKLALSPFISATRDPIQIFRKNRIGEALKDRSESPQEFEKPISHQPRQIYTNSLFIYLMQVQLYNILYINDMKIKSRNQVSITFLMEVRNMY